MMWFGDHGLDVTSREQRLQSEAASLRIENEILMEQIRASELKWTNDLPTEPGWYWWRSVPAIPPMRVIKTWPGTSGLVCYDPWEATPRPIAIASVKGEWAGPIDEPKTS